MWQRFAGGVDTFDIGYPLLFPSNFLFLCLIEVDKHLYRLFFTDSETRLIYIPYVRKIVGMFGKLLFDSVKPAFNPLFRGVFKATILHLTSKDRTNLRMSVWEAINLFVADRIRLSDGGSLVRRVLNVCNPQMLREFYQQRRSQRGSSDCISFNLSN